MELTGATLDAFMQMRADCGRSINGVWYSTRHGITCRCNDGRHEECSGWVFPLGGPRACVCPCHDDDRPTYHVALAQCVKIMNWWKVGTYVTIDGSDVECWKITSINFRTREIHATGPNGQLAIAGFDLLNLHQR